MALSKTLLRAYHLKSLCKRSFTAISPAQNKLFQRAAKAISEADALYITAGAGMGVDSGLPDVCVAALSMV